MSPDWTNALLGGILIGLAVSLMMLWNGRVTGISGIVYGLLNHTGGERAWRLCFLGGLITGGAALRFYKPELFGEPPTKRFLLTLIAGVLVGFGTTLGSGCTSGHGVCGVSRLSKRSLFATITFMASGILTVAALRAWGILP